MKIFNLNPSGPMTVSWDLTSRCNFNCKHCFNRSGDDKYHDFSKELTLSESLEVCEQIIEMKPEVVCFCGGEPTLNKNLFVIGKKLTDVGIKVNMVSNGYLISPEYAKKLKEMKINIVQISLDSHIPSNHDLFRNHKDAFLHATQAIKNLTNEGIFTAVSMCPTKFNCECLEDYTLFVNNIGAKMIRIMPFLPMGRGFDNYLKFKPSNIQYLKLKYNIQKLMEKGFSIEFGDPLDHIKKAIEFERTFPLSIDIKADGKIGISGYLPIFVGSVKRHSIKEYWNNGLSNIWDNKVVHETCDNLKTLDEFNTLYDGNKRLREFDLIDDKN